MFSKKILRTNRMRGQILSKMHECEKKMCHNLVRNNVIAIDPNWIKYKCWSSHIKYIFFVKSIRYTIFQMKFMILMLLRVDHNSSLSLELYEYQGGHLH